MKKLHMDNYKGCLLGGAIGDALGAPIEFMDIKQIKSRYGDKGVVDYVEHPDNVGEFTDDTQMTLFTAEGLLRAWHREMLRGIGGATISLTHQSYLRWLYTQGYFEVKNVNLTEDELHSGWLIKQKELFKKRAPGNTCLASLKNGADGTIGKPINDSKGCGGIMRMAPVGLVFPDERENAFRVGAELAALTHGHPSGYLSAGFFASMISDLAVGISLEKSIDNAIEILKNWDYHDETLIAVENAINLYNRTKSSLQETKNSFPELIEELGQAWVGEEALSISILCSLHFQNDFQKGILASVNHSGDCDSTGSIVGNILGLVNGRKQILSKWIKNLKYHEIVELIGQDLHIGVKGNSFEKDEEWWNKYPGY